LARAGEPWQRRSDERRAVLVARVCAGCWRPALAVALVGGLLGAVALAGVAGARRTSSAYGRYLTSISCAALIAAGNLLALAPATIAAGTPPGTTLRTE
jgi:hypothetical protein